MIIITLFYSNKIKMSYHRCFLQLGSSIRRCDNFVDNDNFFFCHKHLKTKLTDYKNKITLYNGVKCVFIDDKTITSSSKVNYLHLKYNRALNPIKAVLNNGKYVIVEKKKKLSYSEEYYLIKNCSLIKKGSVNNVINAIKRENIKKKWGVKVFSNLDVIPEIKKFNKGYLTCSESEMIEWLCETYEIENKYT